MRIKTKIKRFLLLGRTESAENSETSDRDEHRGNFLGLVGDGISVCQVNCN